jgi:hypothetical protein
MAHRGRFGSRSCSRSRSSFRLSHRQRRQAVQRLTRQSSRQKYSVKSLLRSFFSRTAWRLTEISWLRRETFEMQLLVRVSYARLERTQRTNKKRRQSFVERSDKSMIHSIVVDDVLDNDDLDAVLERARCRRRRRRRFGPFLFVLFRLALQHGVVRRRRRAYAVERAHFSGIAALRRDDVIVRSVVVKLPLLLFPAHQSKHSLHLRELSTHYIS